MAEGIVRPDREYRGHPSQAALAGMPAADILQVREMWIASLVNHWRKRNSNADSSDGIELAIEWVAALTGEMRIRGSADGELHKRG